MSITDCLHHYETLLTGIYHQPTVLGTTLYTRERLTARRLHEQLTEVLATYKRDRPNSIDDSTCMAGFSDLCKMDIKPFVVVLSTS